MQVLDLLDDMARLRQVNERPLCSPKDLEQDPQAKEHKHLEISSAAISPDWDYQK
jgi:hypothetical protein